MSKKYIKTVCLAFSMILIMLVSASAQFNFYDDNDKIQQARFVFDYASFIGEHPDSVRFELYYQIYNFALKFKKEGDVYVSEYEVIVRVNDDKERVVKSSRQEKKIIVETEEKTKSSIDFRTSQANFELAPGKYKVSLVIMDKVDKRNYHKDIDIDLDKYDNKYPKLSGVEFVQAVNSRQDSTESVFDKGNLVVVPSVTRLYGGDGEPKLLYYFEIVQGSDSLEKVKVETILRKKGGSMVYRDTVHVEFSDYIAKQLREISVDEFQPGDYELEIYLKGRRDKKLDEKKETFNIQWTLRSLVENNYDEAISQLELISQPGELDKMKKIKGAEARLQAFNEFWANHDPTPGTRENEFKREFYRRINFANQRFGIYYKAGWKTDRGRIYVQYGEPDEIDDTPFSLSMPPYQVWHYYRYGTYRRFTFVDENEDGDYRLQFPYDGLYQRPDF